MEKKLTDQKAVAQRLRSFRESLGLSQATFAEGVCVNGAPLKRMRLASYEEGRAALPWGVYVEMFWSYGLNAYWLATGGGFPLAPMLLSPLWGGEIHPRTSFLSAFEKHLEKAYSTLAALPSVQPEQLREAGEELLMRLAQLSMMPLEARREVFANPWASEQLRSLYFALSVWRIRPEFREAEERQSAATYARMRKERIERMLKEATGEQKTEGENSRLHTFRILSNIPDVLSTITDLGSLMKRVQNLTSARGAKSRLAKELGVERSSVTSWLKGHYEPDGRTTLRLLQWVQQEERKNKAPQQ